jgi:hypothetical protein
MSKAQNIRRCCAPDELDTTPPLRGCVVYEACAFFIFSRVTLYVPQSYTVYKKLRVFNFEVIPLWFSELAFNFSLLSSN